jgi:plasmid stability protein
MASDTVCLKGDPILPAYVTRDPGGLQSLIQLQSLKATERPTMAILTVRNVAGEVHRALRLRAAEHGRSTEAEVRTILENATKPPSTVRMGDALAEIGRHRGLTNEDLDALVQALEEHTPAEPMPLA